METVKTARGETEQGATAIAGSPVFADIRREWGWVKAGIEEIIAEQPQLPFVPEDVYADCVAEKAVLWVAPEGFVITSTEVDRYSGQKSMLIWLAWAKNRGQNCALKYWEFFDRVAKEAEYDRLMVKTPVPQLEPYLIGQGWAKDTVIYTRDLI